MLPWCSVRLLTIVYSLATSIKKINDRDNVDDCSEIEGLTVSPSPEVIGKVAHMSNEACTSVTVGVNKKVGFLQPTSGYQDFKEYFERPRLISAGSIPVDRSPIFESDITLAALTSWYPSFGTRMTGVHGLRFKLKFILTTASTPFQQAIMCLSFQYGSYLSGTESTISTYYRGDNAAMATNLPHVRHNISETTMTQLDVPYFAADDFFPISAGARSGNTLGYVVLGNVLPYRVIAGVNAPTYRLYVSMHDLELIGSAAFVSRSVVLQSGLDASHSEANRFRISSALSTGSNIIKYVGGAIPTISGAAGTAAWFVESAAKVARSFGYSKPQVEVEPHRVFRSGYICDSNTDVPDNSFVLAPMSRNTLAVGELPGGTEVDEMAFDYILKQPCQIFVGDISTADTIGTTIYGASICPLNFWFRTNSFRPGGNIALPSSSTLTTNCFYPSTLCYIGSMFRYWRGGLRFTFTFSKTKLHGGRVMVGYIPQFTENFTNAPITSTISAIELTGGLPQPSSYCEIFDLRDSSVFSFDVPYISPTLYTMVTASTGGLTMTILDPLVTSGEMSSTVDFMVEVQALDDFSFSCPAPPMLSPITERTGTLSFLQSGLGGVKTLPDEVDLYTSGESIKSLKTLMMIPSYVTTDVNNLSIVDTDLPSFVVRSKWTAATPMPVDSRAFFAYTRSGNAAACYAFFSGSTNWHFYHDGPANRVLMSVVSKQADGGITPSGGVADPRNRSGSSVQRVVSVDNATHVRVPSYGRSARIPVTDANRGTVVWSPGFDTFTWPSYTSNVATHRITNVSGGTVRVVMGRAAADDARLYGWIGPPPCVLFQSLSTLSPDNEGTQF